MEMNRISDELLREAVKQACEREGTYYEEFTKDAKHHFSIRHQIRMRRLYRKMKRKRQKNLWTDIGYIHIRDRKQMLEKSNLLHTV